jgi:hypothetical protein
MQDPGVYGEPVAHAAGIVLCKSRDYVKTVSMQDPVIYGSDSVARVAGIVLCKSCDYCKDSFNAGSWCLLK